MAAEEKEKSIETEHLRIYKNILEWDKSMIQLCNVSVISRVPLEGYRFPLWSLLIGLAGIVMFEVNLVLAILLLFAAGVIIYIWYSKSEERKQQTNLIITMNSGNVLCFIFSDGAFLDRVIHVLREIITSDMKADVVINIKNNTISGNASVLNNMKL